MHSYRIKQHSGLERSLNRCQFQETFIKTRDRDIGQFQENLERDSKKGSIEMTGRMELNDLHHHQK